MSLRDEHRKEMMQSDHTTYDYLPWLEDKVGLLRDRIRTLEAENARMQREAQALISLHLRAMTGDVAENVEWDSAILGLRAIVREGEVR